MSNSGATGGTPSIARLVDQLFASHRRSDGKEYTYQEIAKATAGELSPAYLSRLRSGQISDPGRYRLLLLCKVFNVPASYFFPELEELQELEGQELEAELSPDRQLFVALQAAGLSKEVQKHILGLVAAFRGHQEQDRGSKE